MFKKFNQAEDVTGNTQLKSSLQKQIRNKIVELYPKLDVHITTILPKKEQFKVTPLGVNIAYLPLTFFLVKFRLYQMRVYSQCNKFIITGNIKRRYVMTCNTGWSKKTNALQQFIKKRKIRDFELNLHLLVQNIMLFYETLKSIRFCGPPCIKMT